MKNKYLVIYFLITGFGVSLPVQAENSFWGWLASFERQNEVAPVTDEEYIDECGACHFPYQPGWLPAASWKKLMKPEALEDHFGDNAELSEPLRTNIENILVQNAADTSYKKRSRKIMVSLAKDEAPLRITQVPYIKRKHHDIPNKLIKENDDVMSLSYCDNCHQKAEDAIFDDDTVDIPNHGKWTW
jgi:hypothetical protein